MICEQLSFMKSNYMVNMLVLSEKSGIISRQGRDCGAAVRKYSKLAFVLLNKIPLSLSDKLNSILLQS